MDLWQKIRFHHSRNKGPKNELQLRFLTRLSRLLANGYPIIQALEILQWDPQLKSAASSVQASLKSGKHFDEALEELHFRQSITAYLYFVRSNGDLQNSITTCVAMFEQRMQYMKKFQESVRYPLILLIVFAILLYFVKQSVLPSFVDLFQNSNETSSIIMLTMSFIDMTLTFLLLMSLTSGSFFLLWRFQEKKISIESRIKLYSMLPVYRHYKTMEISFLFASHLSSLLTTGLSMKEILENMAKQKKQPILAHYAALLTSELSKGIYITSMLGSMRFIDNQISLIFQKNADKEALEKDLAIYAEFQTEEMHRKIMKAITYIQPIFFLILASLIVFIYMALMWPMFQLINTI
ncbi:competence-related pilin export protein ComGB [Lentibacillus persicus]|uniref:Competence-related pilin export protein ComGB n=1 Tax=Lentibacillus persicus TaxID=640948 RepID=A0A1I1T4Z4_9BACI|nr:competence type IV pilus assembly protein ComGB [Lentibacillus persicus]SFD53734.1 competence-related pilin export protein ComGB [Lentibacillus persicus]